MHTETVCLSQKGAEVIHGFHFSAADEHREHMKTMKSIRLRASRLMNIDVI